MSPNLLLNCGAPSPVRRATRSGTIRRKRFITFVDDNGAPIRVAYGAALFSFGKDSVITPHAHRHMASAHMVIAGKVRIRTFDRLADEDGAILITPTADTVAEPGHAAAMTSEKDNVHWFAARSGYAMTFDVIVDGLDKGQERYNHPARRSHRRRAPRRRLHPRAASDIRGILEAV